MERSIKILTDKNLCYQCGTCYSICPTSAITMERMESKGYIYPVVNKEKCINCGQCLKVCPINNIDYKEEHLPKNDEFIGIYNSTDRERFDYTASGGVVTEIISYLFKEKRINKAIVTGMSKTNPTNSQVYIIKDDKSLKDVSGSVYQPVSVNEVLKEINKDDRVAFVGLPCHIRGLELFLKYRKNLVNSFVIKIGLICTIGRGKHGTSLTIKKSLKIKKTENIRKIIYRVGTPPGDFQVYFNNNTKKEIPCIELLKNTDFIFMPKGCLFCTDLFNDKADITVGDPWGMNKGKKAMAIVRNNKVTNILDDMITSGGLVYEESITAEQCANTQSHSVSYKIHNYAGRISAYKAIGVTIPNIKNYKVEKSSLKESIGYKLLLANSLVFNTKIGLRLATVIPSKVLYKYRNKVLGMNTAKRRG